MGSRRGSTDSDGGHSRRIRLREWVLLDGHRGVVTVMVAGVTFVFVTLVTASGVSPLQDGQPLFYIFGGLVSGNLTIITVVVSINQLLISRELASPSELQSQIAGTIDYRNNIEEVSGKTAPVEPLGFLRLLFENTRQTAQRLGGLVYSETANDVSDDVEAVVSNVTENADSVDALLQNSDTSTFTVLSATLRTNYARDIHHLRQIKSRYGDRLSSDVTESIETLVNQLHDIDIARQYFKGIYLQQELASLSRILFYVGLPAVTVVIVTLLAFTAGSGTSVPYPYLDLVISATITAGLLPLITLFVFILRTATVARRTAAMVPFTVPLQEK